MKIGRPKSPFFNVAVDFGYMLLAAVLLLGYGGYWLDRRLGTSPILLFIGVLLGIATAFQSLLRRLRDLERTEKAERRRAKEAENDDVPPR